MTWYLALAGQRDHAVALVLACLATLAILHASCLRILAAFPARAGGFGAAGYAATYKMLGPLAGGAAGAALLLAYALAIGFSTAAITQTLFGLLPGTSHGLALPASVLVIALLTWLNLRGVKGPAILFLDGPRLMSAMANDSWLPHRFAALSDRLTMRNGILLLAAAATAAAWNTDGDVRRLAVFLATNVALALSISNVAMVLRVARSGSAFDLALHGLSSILSAAILGGIVYLSFPDGGTALALAGALFGVLILIRRYYQGVRLRLRRLDLSLASLPATAHPAPPFDPLKATAILFVGTYAGLGIHSLLSIFRFFPGYFQNVVFVTIGVIDTGNFKGPDELEALRKTTAQTVDRYVELAGRLGIAATGEAGIGTDAVDAAETICERLAQAYPRHAFFSGKLVFETERWYQRFLHNETAFAIQRRLQWRGYPMIVLPVRVTE